MTEPEALTEDEPCPECTEKMRRLSLIAALVGAAAGCAAMWLVLKNG